MKTFILLSALVVAATALVTCPKDACKGVTHPTLNCLGRRLTKQGFCGCYDACAKVEGEKCHLGSEIFVGMPEMFMCDSGLECTVENGPTGIIGICRKNDGGDGGPVI